MNQVLLARLFQYRVETFIKVIVAYGQLGKVKHHATRAEFQLRGSLHTDSFVWITDAAVLSKANIDEHIMFIDSVNKAFVLNPVENSEIFH